MTPINKPAGADLVAALPRLRRYARVLTGDARSADDLVAETLANLRGRQGSPRQETGLHTRLFAIMHYLYRDQSGHRPVELAQPTPDSAGGPIRRQVIPALAGHAEAENILSRISRLPLDEREALVLVVGEEMSYGEVATLLGVSIGTVLAMLTRARDRLRRMTLD